MLRFRVRQPSSHYSEVVGKKQLARGQTKTSRKCFSVVIREPLGGYKLQGWNFAVDYRITGYGRTMVLGGRVLTPKFGRLYNLSVSASKPRPIGDDS